MSEPTGARPDPGRTVSTHVLDASTGRPASGVEVRLYAVASDREDVCVTSAATDADGRITHVASVPPGTFRLVFESGSYFARSGTSTFYPQVSVTFAIVDEPSHVHVPLLLSPYSYSTYRGS